MSAASLIASHMNVPYGQIVSEADVAASFQRGKLSAASLEANGILAPFFNEIEPSLIIRCARELGVSLQTVNALYEDTLTRGFCASPAWEDAVGPCA
ncbi:hypothetical protein N5D67_07325 [Comamonas aquatica]|uniref:hypothetical protein n=1 Tax=Comamonas aquatica TaxID=225991 RepID=UPI00244C18F7|nr:hypothetical protein [Comamonas aquatica]MDH1902110.1 hypothetical protein [Comamonas aquatica]